MMPEVAVWAPLLDALAAILAETGGEGWLVGGCLRDALLGESVGDVDVALTCEPLPVANQLASDLSLGVGRLGHGTIRLAPRNTSSIHFDLTLLQGDDIVSDLAHRDFTANAMALPLASRAHWLAMVGGQSGAMPGLLDPFGGRAHLLAHRLVAVGPETFRHDPGRIIRAARLLARFGLYPDTTTLLLAREAVPLLATLSPDRLRDEMALLLALPTATDGVALLDDLGALAALYPSLTGDAAAHALATLRQLDKLMGMGVGDAGSGYPALRSWSANDARRIALRRLAFAHADSDHENTMDARVRRALATLFTDDEAARLYHARLLFDGAGKDEAAAADALMVATACALARELPQRQTLAARADTLIAVYMSDRQRLIPPPLLLGRELIATLGVPPGPEVGRLLHAVRRAQLADEVTNREAALALARQLAGA